MYMIPAVHHLQWPNKPLTTLLSILYTRMHARTTAFSELQTQQGVARTGRNTTGPLSRAAPGELRRLCGVLQKTTDDNRRHRGGRDSNKMQSETADFAATTWRTRRSIVSSLNVAHSLHYMKTWRHPQNRKYIMYCTAVRVGPSHSHM